MGTVYVGEHLGLHRKDAIKVLNRSLANDPDAMARFHREARNASTIAHENVCRVYDFGETADGLSFLAMELVEGASLSELLEQEGGALDPIRAARITKSVAEGLQAAHDRSIVHRDLKPGNIMVATRPDGHDDVKVVDFGIAKAADGSEEQEVTRVGLVAGTPEYMSPEHLRGEEPDPRSDLYSLGVVLYRMLTGRLPFTREHPGPKPMALAQARPGVDFPAGLQEVVEQSLRHDPSQRFKAARDMAVAVAGTVSEAPPATVVVPQGRALPRYAVPAMGGVALAVVAGILWVVTQGAGGLHLQRIDPHEAELASGASLTLTPTWVGATGDSSDLADLLSWSTSDPEVAVVDSRGRVEGYRVGAATIFAATTSDTAEAHVNVVAGIPERVVVPSVSLQVGQDLDPDVSAFDAYGNPVEPSEIRWFAEQAGIVRVDSVTGRVRGLRAGSAELAARIPGPSGSFSEGRSTVVVASGPPQSQPPAQSGSTGSGSSRITIAPREAGTILARLYQKALSPPDQAAAQLAVRDSARAIYDLGSSVSGPERGAAAWVVSNMLLWMGGDFDEVELWKARADSLGADAFISGIGGEP
jgi:hypothetical protein